MTWYGITRQGKENMEWRSIASNKITTQHKTTHTTYHSITKHILV